MFWRCFVKSNLNIPQDDKVCEYNQIYGKVKKMRVILLGYKGRRRQRWLDKRWFIKIYNIIIFMFPNTYIQKLREAWTLSRYPSNICVGCTIMLKKIDQKLLLTTTKQNLLAKGVCYHYHYSLYCYLMVCNHSCKNIHTYSPTHKIL